MRASNFFARPIIFGLLATTGLLVSQTSVAKAQPTSIFILDSSGSMWGRLPDKQSKMSAAKKVLGSLVEKLPDNVSAGLIAYGHRRKGDCKDIEVLAEAAPGSGPAIARRIRTLSPRGRTPITNALKLAGEKLIGIEDKTTIVLVSDGIETCKGDPCALAATLAKSHSKLNIHVVGYGVNAKARAQLQCIAEKGRGQYFTADDVSGLTSALTAVTKSIVKAEPVEVQPPVVVDQPEVQNTTRTIKIQATGPGTLRLKLATWTKMPYYWKIVNPETGEEIETSKKREVTLPAGQYQISWRQKEHGAKEVLLPMVVEVKPGQVTEVPVLTGLQLVPPQGMKRPYYWQLLTRADELVKGYRSRKPAAHYWMWEPVPVPPGKYTLVLRQTEHGHGEVIFDNIELKPGKLTQLRLDQGVNVQWPKSWGKVAWIRFESESGHSTKVDYRGPLVVAPGKYKVFFRLNDHIHSETPFGTVTVGQSGFIDARLTSGITFKTKIKGEWTLYAVNLDTGKKSSMYHSWGPMPLGAGRYRFDLKMKGQKVQTIVPEITIKPGQFITAEM